MNIKNEHNYEKIKFDISSHGSKVKGAFNSKTIGHKYLGLDWNICCDNAQSDSELLTF